MANAVSESITRLQAIGAAMALRCATVVLHRRDLDANRDEGVEVTGKKRIDTTVVVDAKLASIGIEHLTLAMSGILSFCDNAM